MNSPESTCAPPPIQEISPQEQFLSQIGVRPARMQLAYLNEESQLPPDQEAVLVRAVKISNKTLVRDALLLGPGDEGKYSTRLLMPEETEAAITGCTQAAYAMATQHADLHLVFPMAGALPLAQRIHALGLPTTRMSAVDINGTIADTTGEASVKGKLPQEVLDPNRFILMVDDIGDSFVSALQLALERKKYRVNLAGQPYDERAGNVLMQQLKTANHTSGNDFPVYEDFARLCQEENVLLMPVFSKNPNAHHALVALALENDQQEHYRWKDLQLELYKRYKTHTLPDVWVVGAGLMDIGISLEDIVDAFPPELKSHPDVAAWTGHQVLLRLGTSIPGLVYVQDVDVEKITKLAARNVQEALSQHEVDKPTWDKD